MALILVLQGPNLNRLGKREPGVYGTVALDEVHRRLVERGRTLGLEVECFQSNYEGALVDFLQERQERAAGIIVNGGALSHYGLSLRDALADAHLPLVEVHLSNVFAREAFRHHDVYAAIATAYVAGMGWRGYLAALQYLAEVLEERRG